MLQTCILVNDMHINKYINYFAILIKVPLLPVLCTLQSSDGFDEIIFSTALYIYLYLV